MIRNQIGDDNFRSALKSYLAKYKHKSVVTNDLLTIFEEKTGQKLGEFFDQWLYKAGHPEITVNYEVENKDNQGQCLTMKITQRQKVIRDYDLEVFKFPIDIKVVFSFDSSNNNNTKEMITEIYTIIISEKETKRRFPFPVDAIGNRANLEWLSIDPQLKILSEIKDTNRSHEMLIKQMHNGSTIYERIQAVQALGNISIDENDKDNKIIDALKSTILKDKFYGVSIKAAQVFSNDNYKKSDYAYKSIKNCLYSTTDKKVMSAIISSIASFGREDCSLLALFAEILGDKNESYFIRSAAANAIGSMMSNTKDIEIMRSYIQMLEDTVKENNSLFKDHVASGAILGLSRFFQYDEHDIVLDIINFLINNSRYESGNTNRIRATATASLGNFLSNKLGDNLNEINTIVFDHLEVLLNDKIWSIRNSAIAALLKTFSGNTIIGLNQDSIKKVLKLLCDVADNDVHAEVREKARKAIDVIKKSQINPEIVDKVKAHLVNNIVRKRLLYKYS
jgi:aminopeptidase N